MNQEQEIRIIPIYKSLIRPQLMFGCDRILVFVLLMATTLLVGPGGIGSGNIVNAISGVILFLIGVQLLAALAKFDPDAREIFRRAVRYKSIYLAVSEVFAKEKKF